MGTHTIVSLLLVLAGSLANAAEGPSSLREDPDARRVETRVSGGLLREFSASTGVGRVRGSLVHVEGALVLTTRLEGTGEHYVASFTGENPVVVTVHFGRAGTVVYRIDGDSEQRAELLSADVADCKALRSGRLFEALLAIRGRPRDSRAPRSDRAAFRSDATSVDAVLAAVTAAAALEPSCGLETTIFQCWSSSPSLAACAGCCNDEAALFTLGVGVVCPGLGPAAPVICGGAVYLMRRDCMLRCEEGFPNPLPREGDRCGVRPDYGTCRLACQPGERQEWEFPCEGPWLRCCVPTP